MESGLRKLGVMHTLQRFLLHQRQSAGWSAVGKGAPILRLGIGHFHIAILLINLLARAVDQVGSMNSTRALVISPFVEVPQHPEDSGGEV